MENKELEKNAPVELEDDALDNVSGGMTRPVIKGVTIAHDDGT